MANLPDRLVLGKYQIEGSYLIGPDAKYLITTRKTTTQAKRKEFLLSVDHDNQRRYVSTLWRISSTAYELESGGHRYTLTRQENVVHISLKSSK